MRGMRCPAEQLTRKVSELQISYAPVHYFSSMNDIRLARLVMINLLQVGDIGVGSIECMHALWLLMPSELEYGNTNRR